MTQLSLRQMHQLTQDLAAEGGTKLTEPQAWRRIAERLADPLRHFTGLCAEVQKVWHGGDISLAVKGMMHMRVTDHRLLQLEPLMIVPRYGYSYRSAYVYEQGAEREARILAALWLAMEAEEEVKAR